MTGDLGERGGDMARRGCGAWKGEGGTTLIKKNLWRHVYHKGDNVNKHLYLLSLPFPPLCMTLLVVVKPVGGG